MQAETDIRILHIIHIIEQPETMVEENMTSRS